MFLRLLGRVRRPRRANHCGRGLRLRPAVEPLEERFTPATLTVNGVADNTTADSVLTLREALAVVNGTLGRALTRGEQAQVSGTLGTNDTVQFGLPAGPQTITLTAGTLSITRAVTINGPGAGLLTIDGNSAGRVLIVGHDYTQNLNLTAALSGLTIAHGKATASGQNYGAGLLNFGTTTVSNVTFTGNAAGSSGGGGVYNDGKLTVTGSTFTGNSVAGGTGAGILNTSAGTLSVTSSTFSGNTGTGGAQAGGVGNSGVATVSGSTFSGNTVDSNGAGIHNSSTGSLTVTNCTFTGGSAGSDGGGLDSDGALTVAGSTFAGNSAGSEGGALDNHGSAPTVLNSTFANNTAHSRGGAINAGGAITLTSCTLTGNRVTSGSGTGGGILATAPAKLFDTIVAGNYRGASPGTTANDVGGTLDSTSAYNLIGTGGSGGLGNGSNGNQVGVGSPGLGGLADNGGPTQTVALLPGSPAIDRGGNAYVTPGETDQRGLPRVVNATVDVGAFEVQAAATTSLTVTGFPSPTTAGVAGTFTVTARDSAGNPATGYRGTVHFTSSDPQAVLPADYTFTAADAGAHTFTATLGTAGTQSITATDAGQGFSGSQTGITVTPAAAASLVVSGYPTPTTAGVASAFTVTARDAFGNTATAYTGTVALSSSDSQAMFAPAGYTFTAADAGVHTFTATLNTVGTQSITATDTAPAGITGTQSGIVVNAAAGAATITVDGTADNTTADGVLTLREAIQYVDGTLGRSLTAGEQAQVSGTPGTNTTIQFSLPAGPQTITLTGGALSITSAVTVNGPGAGLLTVSGNSADRVFIVGQIWSPNPSLTVSINNLTVAGGSALSGSNNYGAGLLNFGTLTLSGMTFSGNAAGSSGGGGVYNVGSLTVSNSLFTGNSVTGVGAGAGILNISSGTLTVTGCTFTNNSATGGSSGGGISNSGTAAVSGSTFSGNTVDSNGAGIHNSSTGNLTVTSCTFANGSAGSDGGGLDSDGALTVAGSTFAGNSAGSEGGALDNHGSAPSVLNSTFANNTAHSRGGAINSSGTLQLVNCTITGDRVTSSSGSGGGLLASAAAQLFNTIVAGNYQGPAPGTTANDIGGTVDSGSAFNLIGTGGSGGLGNGVNGNQVGVADPGLGSLADNGGPTQTVALLPGSPAIDRGGNAYVTPGETDQRGFARVVNGTADIGAFEVQGTMLPPANQASTAGPPANASAAGPGTPGPATRDAPPRLDGRPVAESRTPVRHRHHRPRGRGKRLPTGPPTSAT